jgi:dihydropteroate synthase
MRADPAPISSLDGLGERTLVMGILNVTPDSFSEQGLFFDRSAALRHALEMEGEGADIIDIGGESTRPGHIAVGAEEEQERIIPVVRALAPQVSVPISIDTYKASTARLALEAGARIVNDVWGLQRDPDLASVVAEHDVPVILMHNRLEVDPALDILEDIRRFLDRSLDLARRAGIAERRIILDPGFGFGKTVDQSLEALRRLPEIKALGYPVLAGISRKSLVGRFYDPGVPPRGRLFGTIAAHVLAVQLGADIVRVHDVRPHIEACRVADALARGRA